MTFVKQSIWAIAIVFIAFLIGRESLGHPDVTLSTMVPLWLILPLTFWVGSPWKVASKSDSSDSFQFLLSSIALITSGFLFGILLLLSIGWAMIAVKFIFQFRTSKVSPIRLTAMLCLVFPWVAVDLQLVSWWFRMSSTSVVSTLWEFSGEHVIREGTSLMIGGIPMSVQPACSGLVGLQVILGAGVLFAQLHSLRGKHFWSIVCILPVIAWITNFVRIALISIAGVVWGPEIARGALHDTIGIVILGLALLIISKLLSLCELAEKRSPSPA